MDTKNIIKKIRIFNTDSKVMIEDDGFGHIYVTVFGGYKKYHRQDNLFKNTELSRKFDKKNVNLAKKYYLYIKNNLVINNE